MKHLADEFKQLAAPAVASNDGEHVEAAPSGPEALFRPDKDGCAADVDLPPDEVAAEQLRHELCESWASWCHTRRYFGSPPMPASQLGKLQKRPMVLKMRERDAECSAQLLALHMAIQGQPQDAISAKVFMLTYVYRVKNVKAAAGYLGISRQHWYRLLREFRRHVCVVSKHILKTLEADAVRVVRGRAA